MIERVVVVLTPPYPKAGTYGSVIRMTRRDIYKLQVAAAHLGMSRSQLSRILMLRGAEGILDQLGVKVVFKEARP
jgi:hypothetical protein